MNIQRIREIEALNLSPAEALEYGLIKNSSWQIAEALKENGLEDLYDGDPEDALTFALERLTGSVMTTLLKPHGYQPIPKRKQAKRNDALQLKREAALSH